MPSLVIPDIVSLFNTGVSNSGLSTVTPQLTPADVISTGANNSSGSFLGGLAGTVGGVFNSTLEGVSSVVPSLASAFIVSRALGDEGISNVLAASNGGIPQDPVVSTLPTAAQQLENAAALEQSQTNRNIAIGVAGVGAVAILFAIAR